MFPSAVVRHLTHAHSDHCPVLVDLDGDERLPLGERQFKFLAAWFLHDDFQSLLKREWRLEGDLMQALKQLA